MCFPVQVKTITVEYVSCLKVQCGVLLQTHRPAKRLFIFYTLTVCCPSCSAPCYSFLYSSLYLNRARGLNSKMTISDTADQRYDETWIYQVVQFVMFLTGPVCVYLLTCCIYEHTVSLSVVSSALAVVLYVQL